MVKITASAKKQKTLKKPETTTKKKIIKSKKKKPISISRETTSSSSDSDSESNNSPEEIQKLIEPYTKEQLIEFIINAAISNPNFYNHIRDVADSDESHRKIFVYGLGWDATKETLTLAFKRYGEIEDCHVIIDRATGKAKGFGFVQFKSRKGATKALKEPKKRVGNRSVSCQLASLGPIAANGKNFGNTDRKIYVSNVKSDTDPQRLRAFFAKYGEIETGPIGFDSVTGKSRGFALFVYKNQEGFRKALEEPIKVFEGNQLQCRKATSGKNNGAGVSGAGQDPQPNQQVLVPGQNFGVFGQNPMGLNPAMYGGLFPNPNAAFIAANPMYAPGVLGQMGGGYYPGAPGLNIGVETGLRDYSRSPPPVLKGLGLQSAYPDNKMGSGFGSGSGSNSRSQGAGGSYRDYSSCK
ncbi:UBP1-associated protein 2B-like [Rutidosis leptorrhynchoides]|uniref:UBP1-associated protein 2B-like n=1 Tax=Rutidosis leptorrhynchoides TaxID=125765 RepID=UPI003A99ADA4